MRDQAQNSYEQAFLQMDIEQKRGSKSIYLSPEYHERLTRIVQIIGNDKIPLFAYLNKILEHHFNVYEDAITKEFKEKYKIELIEDTEVKDGIFVKPVHLI